jgi:hypothetical protein
MYALISRLESPSVTIREATTFTFSLVVAEMFYKFHSFSLECAAFLVTWTAMSALADLAVRLSKRTR